MLILLWWNRRTLVLLKKIKQFPAMGVRYLAVSAVCTMVSVIGLQCWAEISVEKFKADGLIGKDTLYSENASLIIELLLRSHAMITLLAICVINTFVLFILSLKVNFHHCCTLLQYVLRFSLWLLHF